MNQFIGIDIGSTSAKTVVLDETERMIYSHVQPTGWSSVDTAGDILDRLKSHGIDPASSFTVATGYGRVAVPYADRQITEITCHARGASYLHELKDLTVIDIGGQDTKIIRVENGMVADFMMNDKCSAGTGRFLEVMANILSVSPEELDLLAQQGGGTSISSLCTVFAESEVISLIGRGEKKENIAFAVVDSIVKKVASQAQRLVKADSRVCLTGGLCGSEYIRRSLSAILKTEVVTRAEGRYAGAIGAALGGMLAQEKTAQGRVQMMKPEGTGEEQK